MPDFRLKVFLSVAERLSFTKAAEELFISQPAVSKHIKLLEENYQCSLFERNGSTLKLTPQGEILRKYAGEILQLEEEMDREIRFHEQKHHGILQLGASTTASQYVLPPYLARFKSRFPGIGLSLKTGNTEHIERFLLEGALDLGVVEGFSKRSGLRYSVFKKDEIVLCTRTQTHSPALLKPAELKSLPFVIREKGSGTLEIIRAALLKKKLKLDDLRIELVLENNESIKTYLKNSNAFAFISISAILEELKQNELKIIDVEHLSMERYYYIVERKEPEPPLPQLLKAFLTHN